MPLPRRDPERVDSCDFYRRGHPAHQGDDEAERGKIPRRGFDEAFLHLHAFIDGDGDRSDGGDAQADDDDFGEAVERLVAPHQQNQHAGGDDQHRKGVVREGKPRDGDFDDNGGEQRDCAGADGGGEEAHDEEHPEIDAVFFRIAFYQAFATVEGVVRAEAEERVFEEVGQHDDERELPAVERPGLGGGDEVRAADGCGRHEDTRPKRAEAAFPGGCGRGHRDSLLFLVRKERIIAAYGATPYINPLDNAIFVVI